MTAFLVALGYTHQEVAAFFEYPTLDALLPDLEIEGRLVIGTKAHLERADGTSRGTASPVNAVKQIAGLTLAALIAQLSNVRSLPSSALISMVDILALSMKYGGLFVGIGIRQLLSRALVAKIGKSAAKWEVWEENVYGQKYSTITFRNLYLWKNVDLRVVATNITRQRPIMFSPVSTPNFSVVDAIAISSAIPLAFRPVRVEYPAFLRSRPSWGRYSNGVANAELDGYYADGGMTQNFPFHVFDGVGSSGALVSGDLAQISRTKLNPFMLGFGFDTPLEVFPDNLSLSPYLLLALDAMMADGEALQIRSDQERKQVVLLDPGSLGTFDFQKTPSDATKEIELAYGRTVDFLR